MLRLSQNISKRLSKRKDSKPVEKKFYGVKKLLLLGTGESGKTTIIKQMKILHINGYTESELRENIADIKANLHESIFEILDSMSRIDPPVEIEFQFSKPSIEYLVNLGSDYVEFKQEYYDHVKTAWLDPGVQKAFQRSNEFQLPDCAEYFLGRIDDIRKTDYIPTTKDILFCRVKTRSISKIEFSIPLDKKYGGGYANFWMFDVGGQRGERRKWIQVFEGLEAILFLIAASEYDQMLREDKSINRFEESLSLFDDIYCSRFLRTAGLIVFLNKQDLLRRKIEQGSKIEDYFPEFKTYISKDKKVNISDDYERAKDFMRHKILELVRPLPVEHVGFIPGKYMDDVLPKRDVYIHYTIATDTRNVKTVFECVQEIILRQTIHELF